MSAAPCAIERRTATGSPIHWTPGAAGVLFGRIPGRDACARVTTNGYVAGVELEFVEGHLAVQDEFRDRRAAQRAAEQWLSLIT